MTVGLIEVGNVWEWTSDPFPTQNRLGMPEGNVPLHRPRLIFMSWPVVPALQRQEEPQWTLKGGSFIDSLEGEFNHKATRKTPALFFVTTLLPRGDRRDPHGQHCRQWQLQHWVSVRADLMGQEPWPPDSSIVSRTPVSVSEAAGKGGGARKRPPDQKVLQKLAEDSLLQLVLPYPFVLQAWR